MSDNLPTNIKELDEYVKNIDPDILNELILQVTEDVLIIDLNNSEYRSYKDSVIKMYEIFLRLNRNVFNNETLDISEPRLSFSKIAKEFNLSGCRIQQIYAKYSRFVKRRLLHYFKHGTMYYYMELRYLITALPNIIK
jgi:hypothetical protein